jgi:hypothetical protein
VAIVYFVRGGSGNRRTNDGREVPLIEIAKAFPNCRAVWSEHARIFNSQSPVNLVSSYRYVVVHVQGGEVAGQFVKDGYWHLEGVSPTEFRKRFSRQ